MKPLGFSASTRTMAVGRTHDRSALGSLNNRIADAKCIIKYEGGLDHCDVPALAHLLNKTPMGPIGYANGLEQMKRLVDKGLCVGMETCHQTLAIPMPESEAVGWFTSRWTYTAKTRSRVMSCIRKKDTKPELRVRRLLHQLGYRFRLHRETSGGAGHCLAVL